MFKVVAFNEGLAQFMKSCQLMVGGDCCRKLLGKRQAKISRKIICIEVSSRKREQRC